MKRLVLFILLFAAIKVAGQTTGYLRFDTVLIYKQGGTAELALMNKTKDTLGVLVNYGNGRTRFMKSRAINDSTIVVGLDTLVIRGATGGSGGSSGQLQTMVRPPVDVLAGDSALGIPDTLVFRVPGYGIVYDSDTAIMVDTLNVMSRLRGQKIADSLGAIKVNYSDTSSMLSPYLRRADTTAMLSPYLRKALTSGNIFVGNGSNIATGVSPSGDISSISTGGAVTIANNAVSDAKLRQSSGLSVIGRTSNSTGNVADITASSDNTALRRQGTTLSFGKIDENMIDSVRYDQLINAPALFPGMYIGPAESFNPGFLVFAVGIARPSNTFSNGNPITWEFLTNSTSHNYSFFDSVYGNTGTARLVIRYPNVKNVLNMTVKIDESFSQQGLFCGPTVGLTTAEIQVSRFYTMGIRLTGAGTNTWTENTTLGLGTAFDMSTYSTADGSTSFNITSTYGTDYNAVNLQYIGPNNYHIRRSYSGLGGYSAKFHLVDEFNNPVGTNPTTSDEVIITNGGMNAQTISMATWSSSTNSWMTNIYNFWIFGAFEAWMVAAPASSSAIQVRWQTSYPSATNYKIYRSTSLWGTYTLIHTGTEGIYTDGGLSANTVYYYKMVAVIGGVDTDITTFRTNTYQ